MTYRLGILCVCAALAGCGSLNFRSLVPSAGGDTSEGQLRPQSRPGELDVSVRRPPVSARTVEEFDTTTVEERQAAAAPVAVSAERALGPTIVSLGDPTRPGFWIETPLVSALGSGRVVFPATGKSSQVELIPIDGPATAGSRMSLPAMRLIDAPLTGLPEVRVFRVSG